MKKRHHRRGALLVLAAILMILMGAMLAFTVDLGFLLSARTEMQRSADAAALAGAWQMVSDDILRNETNAIDSAARETAVDLAALNQVIQTSPYLDVENDIKLGYLADPSNHNESISFYNPRQYNTVQVTMQYSAEKNSPISLLFAPLIGINSSDLAVTAAATFSTNNTVGFHITDKTGNCSLMPFTVTVEDWENLLAGNGDDNWAFDPETGEVSPGQDGIPEMRMFPERENTSKGNGKSQGVGGGITPGNFGTVDIGNTNNAAPDLWRQIREGPSAEDFAYYPNNELKLDPVTGKLYLNGDTGITASMKKALADIIGEPRTIFLYNDVTGQGNNTWFTIVGFAGVRVLDFTLTGKDKYILIQPAVAVDSTAISGDTDSSYFVGPPVHLVR